jgi:hypothetical protein
MVIDRLPFPAFLGLAFQRARASGTGRKSRMLVTLGYFSPSIS